MLPLAERLRPKTLEDFQGQKHLLGKNKPLTLFVEQGFLPSMLFYGSPGIGKTTLSQLLAEKIGAELHFFSAVTTGIGEIKTIFEQAKNRMQIGKKTILFLDEIHRFSKSQQDILLGAVEKGWIILIGATTENPSFAIVPALLSRCQVYILEKLDTQALQNMLQKAMENTGFFLEPAAEDYLIQIADGDGRKLFQLFEQIQMSFPHLSKIDLPTLQNQNFTWVKNHDTTAHYEIISALIKSIRGSDSKAAMYWLARLIDGGEDPLFIGRRLIISAAEDIGLANPNALLLANQTFDALQKIGMPEGRIPLALCVQYLSESKKSNQAYLEIQKMMAYVQKNPPHPVPLHLRNSNSATTKNQGFGKDYIYSHDHPEKKQDFLPLEFLED